MHKPKKKCTVCPLKSLNLGTAFAVFINVVTRCSKLDMRYRIRALTAPPGGKLRLELLAFVSRKRYEVGEKSELQSSRALSIKYKKRPH